MGTLTFGTTDKSKTFFLKWPSITTGPPKFFDLPPCLFKGQLISKAIYGLLTCPKKRMNEFDLFAMKIKKANKQIRSFIFWEKLADHKLLSRLTDL